MNDAQDVRRLVGRANPVPAGTFAGAAQDPPAQAILRGILEQPLAGSAAHNRQQNGLWTRRRFVTASAGTAVALTGGVVAYRLLTPAPLATPPLLAYRLSGASMSVPSAEESLLALATLATEQADARPVADAAFSRITMNIWDLSVAAADGGTTSAVIPRVVRQWTPLAAGGEIRRMEFRGSPDLFERANEATAAAVSSAAAHADETFPAARRTVGPPPSELAAASSLEDLKERLLWGRTPQDASQTYRLLRNIRILHAYHVVQPSVASRLWRMLARQRDLLPAGELTDRAGRRGQAFAYDFDRSLPKRWILIVSSQDGRLLALEEVLTKEAGKLNIRPPAVIGYTLFLNQEWTAVSE
ncbi:hypothetical protein ACWEU6_10220 [Streptosporangium sandarakinum]|uniref:hypothetical protein n=1 Tax=Streptosporangium sandarakinum TaxID=1260955 RepID=UPI0036ACD9FB